MVEVEGDTVMEVVGEVEVITTEEEEENEEGVVAVVFGTVVGVGVIF